MQKGFVRMKHKKQNKNNKYDNDINCITNGVNIDI